MLSREMDPNRGRSGRTLLHLEALEDRCCPSGIAYNAQLHTLTLTGDSTSDTFTVRDSGNGTVNATVVDGHGHQTTLTKSGVQHIAIQSGTGNDRINYTLLNRLTASEQISLNLGKGTDTVSLDFSKGVAAPSLSVDVEGGVGFRPGQRRLRRDPEHAPELRHPPRHRPQPVPRRDQRRPDRHGQRQRVGQGQRRLRRHERRGPRQHRPDGGADDHRAGRRRARTPCTPTTGAGWTAT